MGDVEALLQKRQHWNNLLRENLQVAQKRMRQQANKKRSERTFEAGDWVHLKLQPYRQSSLALRQSLKMSAK